MLTPRFEITQTDSDVFITVHAPYANIKDTEVYVDRTDFIFFSSPYYLRLKLPGEIEENDSSAGSYDCGKGVFSLAFSKMTKGEHFENLDMITNLLAPPKKKNTIVPNIEVIGNPSVDSDKLNENDNEDSNKENDVDDGNEWFMDQNVSKQNINDLLGSPKYGFGNKIFGALAAFEPAWIKEIIDLPTPDRTPQVERKSLREKQEFEDFNEEHYLADLMQADLIEPYISYTPEWYTLQKEQVSLNEVEVDLLKELPNKEYLLNNAEIQRLLLNLVDILYGSCYNHRTTMGDNTVESSWTINKLSSTLCWFQDFANMEEVLIACFRRSLCYPLYRNWDLSMKVFEDVKKVVSLGKKYVVKRLCEVHGLFNNSYEPRYLLNQLYIKDYLIWLQQAPDSLIDSLNSVLSNIHPSKTDMELELTELEEAAYSVQEKDLVIENAIHDMMDLFNELGVDNEEKEKPKNVFLVKEKQFLKDLLSSSSSSSDSSDTESETDSESSSSSSSTSTKDSSLDSDDTSESE